MKRWPAWSAPLLGGFGGGLAGLAITGDPRFPFPPIYSMLGGVALGVLAGLIVWLQDKLRPAVDEPPSVATRIATRWAISAPSSRWPGIFLMAAGVGCLGANHALALVAGKKFAPLVLGGSVFLSLGLAGVLLPQLLTAGATGERVSWQGHLVGGILGVGGLAVGMYLWLVVY